MKLWGEGGVCVAGWHEPTAKHGAGSKEEDTRRSSGLSPQHQRHLSHVTVKGAGVTAGVPETYQHLQKHLNTSGYIFIVYMHTYVLRTKLKTWITLSFEIVRFYFL